MKVSECCKRVVVVASPKDDLAHAAQIMRDKHVGFLIVVEGSGDRRVPVGVVTDRDIVVQVIAREVDPRSVVVGDVMTRGPVICLESNDIEDVIESMESAGIRRMPVVSDRGGLTGVIAIDDAILMVSKMLVGISGAVRRERRLEREFRAA
jgi:CBS domain-containing protein